MLVKETFRTAWRSLVSNRLRTALTALGMVIGVAAVVAVLAVGEGAKANVEGRVRSLGTNLVTIRPARGRTGVVRSSTVQTLTRKDAEAIEHLAGVSAVAPEVGGNAQIRYRTANLNASVQGVTEEYLSVRALTVRVGLGFTALDDQQRSRVAVIGSNVARDLFGDVSPLGEAIQINGIAFRVVGVLEEKGAASFGSPDDMVLVPLGTHQGVLFGQDYLSAVNVQVADEGQSAAVQARASELLRLRHRLRADEEDDFEVRSQTEMLETLGAITQTFTALLGSVAAVSLLVGGIGIMNIMLVSVRERTREIGVRMAVGARRRDVLLQFLVEAVVVSIAGGVAGIAVGYLAAGLIARLGGWDTVVPLYSVLLALGVSIVIGIVFGVSPARRAAMLDPVVALRTD
jgi:putative ABC transport system permease protein